VLFFITMLPDAHIFASWARANYSPETGIPEPGSSLYDGDTEFIPVHRSQYLFSPSDNRKSAGSVPKVPQVFKNPVTESHIRECQYRFPDRIGQGEGEDADPKKPENLLSRSLISF
jgi:hypothetical protein